LINFSGPPRAQTPAETWQNWCLNALLRACNAPWQVDSAASQADSAGSIPVICSKGLPRPPLRHRRYRLRPRPLRLPGPTRTPTRMATPPRHRHERLLHRPPHRLLRRQRPFLPLWNHLPHWTYWATAEPRRRAAHLARAPPLHTINIRQANTRARERVIVGPRRLPLVPAAQVISSAIWQRTSEGRDVQFRFMLDHRVLVAA
jgi:hypothetical protein